MGARSGDLYNEISQMNYNRQPRQSTGYNFAPLDYPAQQWINPEMVAMNQAMFASGSIYDYLDGVRAWYPPPKAKKKKPDYGPSGPGTIPHEGGDNIGSIGNTSPSGLGFNRFGMPFQGFGGLGGQERSAGPSQVSREGDQPYGSDGEEVFSTDREGFSYADE